MQKRRASEVRRPGEKRPKNRILAALPDEAFQRLLPELETISVRPKQLLHKAGEPVENVYFPNGGVFSITTTLPDGSMVEAATVGDEGMLGVEAFLGDGARANGDTMMQVPDTDLVRIRARTFRREVEQHRELHILMGRYTQTVIAQMMQSAACNALHAVRERCARWLLMTHDRMHHQDFKLSHEFLAMMLGVQRPTVTTVAGTLQEAGLIAYRHGHVKVLNRSGLEAASCGCYAIIRTYCDGQFGPIPGKRS